MLWGQQGEGRCGRSRVRGDAGTAGTLTPVSLWEAQSQVLDPHWVREQGTLLGHHASGPPRLGPPGQVSLDMTAPLCQGRWVSRP